MQTNPVFVIDGGNTHIKLGVFSLGNLTSVHRCSSAQEMGAMLTPESTVVMANVGSQEMSSECQRVGCAFSEFSTTIMKAYQFKPFKCG